MPTKKTNLKEQQLKKRDRIERSGYQRENMLTNKLAEPGRYSKKLDKSGAYERRYNETIANGLASQVYYRSTGELTTDRAKLKKKYGKK